MKIMTHLRDKLTCVPAIIFQLKQEMVTKNIFPQSLKDLKVHYKNDRFIGIV